MRYSMIAKRLAGPSSAALLIFSTSIGVAHADPSLADIAEQIRALRAENAQIRAENRQMKAAISDMKGENRRVREKVRTVVARTPEPYHLPPPGAPFIGGGVPAIVTPDKRLQFGTITITPGGFVAAESAFRSRTEQVDIGSGYQNRRPARTSSVSLRASLASRFWPKRRSRRPSWLAPTASSISSARA